MSYSNQSLILIYMVLSLLVAAFFDVRYRRIPNALTLSILVVAFAGHGFCAGFEGVLSGITGFSLGFFLLFIPHLLGGMGAGDVKLMGAVGASLGGANTIVALFFVAVCGGGLSACYMVTRGNSMKTLGALWQALVHFVIHRDYSLLKYKKGELKQEGIPFAVAIAAGVFLYIIYVWRTTGMLPVLTPS